jgi:hypothetical protein
VSSVSSQERVPISGSALSKGRWAHYGGHTAPDVRKIVYYGTCLQLYAEAVCKANTLSPQMHRLHKLLLTLALTYCATLVLSAVLQPKQQRAPSDQPMLVQPFRVLARAAQSRKMNTAAGSEALKKVPAGEHSVLTSPDACDCVD